MSLQLTDNGPITVAIARTLFDEAMRKSKPLQRLDPTWMETPGFSGYRNPDTNNVFVGFAMGLRGLERLCSGNGISVNHIISNLLISIEESKADDRPEILPH